MNENILAIGNTIDNITTIKNILKLYLPNYNILTTLSSAEGIKIAEQEQPKVILLDILMPEMDGFKPAKN